MIKKQDRRIRKTKKLIEESLFTLMKDNPYRKIRISQIVDHADISRSTFYLHYETKDDLLFSVVDEIIDEYFESINQVIRGHPENPTRLLFSKWQQNIEKMQLIMDARMEYRIFQRMREFNIKRKDAVETVNPLLNDYINNMLDGALFALLLRWTKDGANVPVSQMELVFEGLNFESLYRELGEKIPAFGKHE